MQRTFHVILVSAMLCTAVGPLSACDSSANDKACDLPVTLKPTGVQPGKTLHVTVTKPGCFDAMSAEKQDSEHMSISAPGIKDAPQIPIKFVQGKFTYDFVIPQSAKAGKATLEIPYQCNDGESCASQSVPFTIVK